MFCPVRIVLVYIVSARERDTVGFAQCQGGVACLVGGYLSGMQRMSEQNTSDARSGGLGSDFVYLEVERLSLPSELKICSLQICRLKDRHRFLLPRVPPKDEQRQKGKEHTFMTGIQFPVAQILFALTNNSSQEGRQFSQPSLRRECDKFLEGGFPIITEFAPCPTSSSFSGCDKPIK